MKVVRTSDVPWTDALKRGAFSQRRKALGGERLTCSLWELPPGKKSFPLHAHLVGSQPSARRFVFRSEAQADSLDGEPDA